MKFLSTSLLFLIIFFVIIIGVMPIFTQADEVVRIDNPVGSQNVGDIIDSIARVLRVIAIGVGGIMVIWSGVMIMTSGGSEEKATKGKKTLTWTVIGVAIVILAQLLVGIILELLS